MFLEHIPKILYITAYNYQVTKTSITSSHISPATQQTMTLLPSLSSAYQHHTTTVSYVHTGGRGGGVQGSVVAGAVAGTLAGMLVIPIAVATVCLTVTYYHHQALRKKQQRVAEREVDGVETNPAYAATAFSRAVKTNPNPAYSTTTFNQDMNTDHNPVYASIATNYAGPDHQHCDAPGDPRQAAVVDSKLYAEPDLTTMTLHLTSEDYI